MVKNLSTLTWAHQKNVYAKKICKKTHFLGLFFPVKSFQKYFQYFYKLCDNSNFALFEPAHQKNLGAKRAKAPTIKSFV